MDTKAFENLELIPELLLSIKALENRFARLEPPITTKEQVAKFLDVSKRTINNYIAQGYFVEGIHFYRKGVKILVFVEDAIIDFRNKKMRGLVKNEKIAI
jgi:hypothetical protein